MPAFDPLHDLPGPSASLSPPEQLAQALASRICHDLVSPVGAVVNGTDLIAEFGASPDGGEIAMIAQSAERAAAILGFFRLAFGAASAESAEIARLALAETMEKMIASNRIGFEVNAVEGPALPRPHAKLAALMALSARATLGMRGHVRVDLNTLENLPIRVAATGQIDAARLDRLTGFLETPEQPPESNAVEFALARPAAQAAGAVLTVIPLSDGFRLSAEPG